MTRTSTYPHWFRERMWRTVGSARVVSARFAVHVSTVYRHRQREFATGSLAPTVRRGGPPPKTTAMQDRVLRLLTRLRPDITLPEASRALAEFGVQVSPSTISRRWKSLGFTRKKLRVFAQQRDEARRLYFWENGPEAPIGVAGVAGVPPLSLIDVDECGVVLNEVERRVGLAPRGQRASMPGRYSRGAVRHNVILAIDMIRGPVAFWITPVNVDADVFRLFVQLLLLPQLQPEPHAFHFRRIIMWDNLRAHFNEDTLASVRTAGHLVVARPPYSPDMAPIECAFSKLKAYLRREKANITEANLPRYIMQGLATITPNNVVGWFHHCHYEAPGFTRKVYSTPRLEEM